MENYKKYTELQNQIDELETKKKLLRVDIEKELPEEGFKDKNINLYWTRSKKWTYPETVKAIELKLEETVEPLKLKLKEVAKPIEEEIKNAKIESETDGTATVEESKRLTIRINK